MRVGGGLAAVVLAVGSIASAATLHEDSFDADVAGWSGGLAGSPSPVHVPTEVESGYIQVSASDINSHLALLNVQPAWIGDYGTIGAAVVNVSMMVPADRDPLDIRLVLFGPTNLGNRWTSSVAAAVPNDGAWRDYSFSLAEANLTRVQGTTTYAQLMAGVVQVMLRHNSGEPSSGGSFVANGLLNLDNLELAATPTEPTPGDFNGDTLVNSADLDDAELGFKARFGVDLDGANILDWQRNLSVPQSAAAIGAVPEPNTLALVGATVLVAARRRKRSVSAPA